MRNEKYFNQVYAPGELDVQLNNPRVGTVMCAAVDAYPWGRNVWDYAGFIDDVASERSGEYGCAGSEGAELSAY